MTTNYYELQAGTIATVLIDTSHGCHNMIEREGVATLINRAAAEQNEDGVVVAEVGLMPYAEGSRDGYADLGDVGEHGIPETVEVSFVDYADGSSLVITWDEDGFGEVLAVATHRGARPVVVAR